MIRGFFCVVRSSNILTKFLQLSRRIEETHTSLWEHSKASSNQTPSSYLVELEQVANEIDNECLSVMEASNHLNSKFREINSGMQ